MLQATDIDSGAFGQVRNYTIRDNTDTWVPTLDPPADEIQELSDSLKQLGMLKCAKLVKLRFNHNVFLVLLLLII